MQAQGMELIRRACQSDQLPALVFLKGEGWVLLKTPRGGSNGVGEDEVTVTLKHK